MDDKNKKVITYIVGLLTGLVFIPIFQEMLYVILSWIEYFKIKPSELLLKGNGKLLKLL